jgi:hypothetical protein
LLWIKKLSVDFTDHLFSGEEAMRPRIESEERGLLNNSPSHANRQARSGLPRGSNDVEPRHPSDTWNLGVDRMSFSGHVFRRALDIVDEHPEPCRIR